MVCALCLTVFLCFVIKRINTGKTSTSNIIGHSGIQALAGKCHSGVATVPGLFDALACTNVVLALFVNDSFFDCVILRCCCLNQD